MDRPHNSIMVKCVSTIVEITTFALLLSTPLPDMTSIVVLHAEVFWKSYTMYQMFEAVKSSNHNQFMAV